MRMLNALVFGAGVVVVSVGPRPVLSLVTSETLVVVDEVLSEESGAPPRQAYSSSRDDVANVAALIAAVRNGNPVLCELAARGASWDGNWRFVGPASPHMRNAPTMDVVKFAASSPKGREVIPPLRAALGDPDPCVRRFVAPLLGRTQHDAAVDALVAALRDPSALTREAAAIGLRFADKPRTIDPLTRALEDQESPVRAAAAWALGEIEDARAIPALERALKDGDAVVRMNAAWGLGEIEDPAAIPALTATLREDRDPEVRRMAAWALGNLK
jgi:vesicle coat complex subunit